MVSLGSWQIFWVANEYMEEVGILIYDAAHVCVCVCVLESFAMREILILTHSFYGFGAHKMNVCVCTGLLANCF